MEKLYDNCQKNYFPIGFVLAGREKELWMWKKAGC